MSSIVKVIAPPSSSLATEVATINPVVTASSVMVATGVTDKTIGSLTALIVPSTVPVSVSVPSLTV